MQRSVRARLLMSRSGVAYLFYNSPADYDRAERIRELSFRCHVAWNEVDNYDTIVGIGTNAEVASEGFGTDFRVVSELDWTEEDRRNAEGIKRDLGYFKSSKEKRAQREEHPQREPSREHALEHSASLRSAPPVAFREPP